MPQVITITPTGGLEGLQHKKGRGVDLRGFGLADIRRVSEVVWLENMQAWAVRFILPPLSNQYLTLGLSLYLHGKLDNVPEDKRRTILLFHEYEDAVDAEVLTLNHIRYNDFFDKLGDYFLLYSVTCADGMGGIFKSLK